MWVEHLDFLRQHGVLPLQLREGLCERLPEGGGPIDLVRFAGHGGGVTGTKALEVGPGSGGEEGLGVDVMKPED